MEINESTIKDCKLKVHNVEKEIAKGIIGQENIIRQVLLGVLTGGNILLEGVPGLGKTQLVKTLAKVMDLSFSRIQFTPDLMPADVVGTNMYVEDNHGKGHFEYQKGPVFANLLLADEINRATPKTQSAMLEAMQEMTVTVGNNTYELPQPFMVLATQNPIEMEGTYPLPEAQLDRFMFKVLVEFPNLDELSRIMDLTVDCIGNEPEKIISSSDILNMRKIINDIPVAKYVKEYALRLVVATHSELPDAPEIARKYLKYGASPRAAQAILKSAKANALLEGRYNVSFDDINYVALPCLRHRIFLNFEAISDGINNDEFIKMLINEIKA
ncbi:AAA family ATPase [Vallitalea guaymasensis]|uniref:AAA family ATPase n=1 Tax=Vallitalea guaymasensis TaxID=1185412 RepID=UPI000DE31121|nr:MoxR family ATPase [Vallitalea guaymasensis]